MKIVSNSKTYRLLVGVLEISNIIVDKGVIAYIMEMRKFRSLTK